jgi:TnpA family transposase
MATANPGYFGRGRGVTFYNYTSNQFSQFGTKVVPTTVRDATYVLDGILDNETDLEILEHTTDTAGYTDVVFALFDLLGLQFAPRLRDVAGHKLYRVGPIDGFLHPAPLLRGTIQRSVILERWNDLLRVAGSLKLGWVTASLLLSRLQAPPRRNALIKALEEYGRVVKTLFVLRYLESEDYRRRINAQLNKGESIHALRRYLFFADEGRVRRRHVDEQANQASCLVVNAVITWNTVYMAAALEQLRVEGVDIADDSVAHLSPTLSVHVNPYGRYRFDTELVLGTEQLRPLRTPDAGP